MEDLLKGIEEIGGDNGGVEGGRDNGGIKGFFVSLAERFLDRYPGIVEGTRVYGEVSAERDKLAGELGEVSSERDGFREEVSSLGEKLKGVSDERKELRARCEQIEIEYGMVEQRAVDFAGMVVGLRGSIGEKDALIGFNKKTISRLEEELAVLRKEECQMVQRECAGIYSGLEGVYFVLDWGTKDVVAQSPDAVKMYGDLVGKKVYDVIVGTTEEKRAVANEFNRKIPEEHIYTNVGGKEKVARVSVDIADYSTKIRMNGGNLREQRLRHSIILNLSVLGRLREVAHHLKGKRCLQQRLTDDVAAESLIKEVREGGLEGIA